MISFFIILGIVLWIFIAFWPARVASRKGHNFLLWFLISLPFFWITLIAAYMVAPKQKPGMTPTPTASDE